MKNTPSFLVAPLTAIALSLSVARAAEVTIPNEFQANTPAKAAEVNENFGTVAKAINQHDTRIGAVEASVATLQTEVDAAEANLATKVSKSGDTMTGDLTVPKVAYTAPRTHTACVSGDLFQPRVSSDAYSSGMGFGGSRITTTSSTGTMQAQVHLPDGATITDITFILYDNDSTNDLKVVAFVQQFGGSYHDLTPGGAEYATSGASSIVQSIGMVPTTNTRVVNASGAVVARVYPTTGSVWSANTIIRGVVFTYTLPEAQ